MGANCIESTFAERLFLVLLIMTKGDLAEDTDTLFKKSNVLKTQVTEYTWGENRLICETEQTFTI